VDEHHDALDRFAAGDPCARRLMHFDRFVVLTIARDGPPGCMAIYGLAMRRDVHAIPVLLEFLARRWPDGVPATTRAQAATTTGRPP